MSKNNVAGSFAAFTRHRGEQKGLYGCSKSALTLLLLLSSTAYSADAPVEPNKNSSWIYHVALGAQLVPKYDEQTGKNLGLKDQKFFAQLNADGRFGSETCSWTTLCLHGGVNLTLAGTSVQRADKPVFSPKEFNDVAQSIIAAGYLYWPGLQFGEPGQAGKKVHNAGLITRVGAISRESLDTNGDAITWYYSGGLQYTYEGYQAQGFYNGIPNGYIRMSAARFEDYAGLGRSARVIAEGALEVVPSLGLYLGLQGNFGSGPDELAVVFSFVRRPDQLASVFSGLVGAKKDE